MTPTLKDTDSAGQGREEGNSGKSLPHAYPLDHLRPSDDLLVGTISSIERLHKASDTLADQMIWQAALWALRAALTHPPATGCGVLEAPDAPLFEMRPTTWKDGWRSGYLAALDRQTGEREGWPAPRPISTLPPQTTVLAFSPNAPDGWEVVYRMKSGEMYGSDYGDQTDWLPLPAAPRDADRAAGQGEVA